MTSAFRQKIRTAIGDEQLQTALDRNALRRKSARIEAIGSLDDSEVLRRRANEIRMRSLAGLDTYLDEFTENLRANGVHVHRAPTAIEAARLVVGIASQHGARLIAKSKSMVTEEISLNDHLSRAGFEVVETDLGEFIVQLRGEKPSHVITPAVHLRREDVAETFQEALGMVYTTNVDVMTRHARQRLREVFLTAEVGISGVNFGVADTGTICLVTNEGNGRMITTLPRVHVALMGIERLVPTVADLTVMLELLARSATGQNATSYVSLIHSPRREEDPDGPEHRHLILVDNGRHSLRKTPYADSLLCIRCGACLNACPVFQEIGGHAYGSIYQGPIGSVVSPGLFGIENYGHLAKASTLCGACLEACPIGIDLPGLLIRVRNDYEGGSASDRLSRWAIRVFTWLMGSPRRYALGQRWAAALSKWLPRKKGWIRTLPPPLSAWTRSRDFPSFADESFRVRISSLNLSARKAESFVADDAEPEAEKMPEQDLVEKFGDSLQAIGGKFVRVGMKDASGHVLEMLRDLGVRSVLAWVQSESPILEAVERSGITFLNPFIPLESMDLRSKSLRELDGAEVGLTGAIAGFADTGTVVLPSGPGRSQLASLLPNVHIVILATRSIYKTMDQWIQAGGDQDLKTSAAVTFVSGPSRTADIEMTMTMGVHGPGKVIVVGVD